ncbi:MAG TPA: ABC transporter permease, partial [Blastocatellia bacterium]|nr:ABC transporter permease [Blastocatellia bacterium]
MENLWQDLRYGMRGLGKQPGFTVVAIIALALGTGANTAIFSVVNALLLRPLNYAAPQQLVMVWGTNSRSNVIKDGLSVPNLLDYREQSSLLDQVAGYSQADLNLSRGGEPIHVQGTLVTANYFTTLGVAARYGRVFTDGEDQSRAPRVAVISDALWQRQFASDPGLLDQTIQLNNDSFTVVGILPPGFQPVNLGDEIFVPMALDGGDIQRTPQVGPPEIMKMRNLRCLYAFGRLKSGVSVAQAQSEMNAITAHNEVLYPNENTDIGVSLVGMQEELVGDIKPKLKLLLIVVAAVLLIACVNVASLLLARASSRQKEIAIRTALGASRGRIISQLLTESVLLGLAGGVVGLALAFAGLRLVVALNPPNIPRLSEINIDLIVLVFTLAVSLVTGVVFGLVPALQASKPNLNETLKEGSRGSSAGGNRQRLRRALVVVELLLTTLLLIVTGLMLKSFSSLQKVNPGFNPSNVLTMWVGLPQARYLEDDQIIGFFDQAFARLEAVPGVESAAGVTCLPLTTNFIARFRFTIDGAPPATPNERLQANFRGTQYNYFKTMGIALKQGRLFNETDGEKSPPVVVVNETLAKFIADRLQSDAAVGKRIVIPGLGKAPREIVGVVSDVKHASLDTDAGWELYVPYQQKPLSVMNLVVRTAGDPARLTSSVRQAIFAVDPGQPIYDVKTMDQVVGDSLSQPRLYSALLIVFAAVALTLAAVGIYGVMNSTVNQRVHEIGIRMALGAQRSDILKMIVGQGMAMALLGVVLGVAAALILSFTMAQLITGLLFEVGVRDLTAFAAAPVALAIIAFLSIYIPARRATKIDPMVALRYE